MISEKLLRLQTLALAAAVDQDLIGDRGLCVSPYSFVELQLYNNIVGSTAIANISVWVAGEDGLFTRLAPNWGPLAIGASVVIGVPTNTQFLRLTATLAAAGACQLVGNTR